MTQVVEEKRLRGDEIILSRTWRDRHELDFNGARVEFFESSSAERVTFYDRTRGQFMPHQFHLMLHEFHFMTEPTRGVDQVIN